MVLDVRLALLYHVPMHQVLPLKKQPKTTLTYTEGAAGPTETRLVYTPMPNFPLRIEPELRAELDAYALKEQRSLNTLINRFIRNGLKKARS